MFGLGMMELLIILVVVLVLFGAGKLPGVMGEFGRGISMFKKGMSGEDTEEDKKEEGAKAPKAKAKAKTKPKNTAKKK